MAEERLDKLIIERKLVSTRVRAEKIIEETGVLVNGKLITKAGKKFPTDVEIVLLAEEIPWVSRGALKLIKAVEEWQLDFKDKVVIDIGASTGGFTEVALHFAAKQVFCVDVGTKQLHEKIKADERVVNLEKTHVRELNHNLIPLLVDTCVIDVSFISLEKIFPFIHSFIKSGGDVIALVKPQFEVGKEHVSKKGLVKNEQLFPTVIEKIKHAGLKNNFIFEAYCDSPILGGDGNKEFLMRLRKS
jgi:23S rRNA (cytidine1920-2'-O)/16S rRNA (cytidine1409-2'-O)-methyltransferase